MSENTTPNTPDLSARIASLPENSRESLETIVATLEREERRKQQKQAERLEKLENGTRILPVHEALALHVIGKMAIGLSLTVNDVHADQSSLFYLFRNISEALESGLKHVDWREVKQLHDAE